ncbi:uncharacterized protein LOC143461980 [Clavelina lepadiformis]|uniref:uncharacterized protein LOC143461980 n=1 Tax=Clavelina lepadiformis TaxID=159417 RepID=UPI004042C93F
MSLVIVTRLEIAEMKLQIRLFALPRIKRNGIDQNSAGPWKDIDTIVEIWLILIFTKNLVCSMLVLLMETRKLLHRRCLVLLLNAKKKADNCATGDKTLAGRFWNVQLTAITKDVPPPVLTVAPILQLQQVAQSLEQ